MKSEADAALEARLAPYVKQESFYSLVIALAAFASVVLLLLPSSYFVIPVIIAAGVGIARYHLRKTMLEIRAGAGNGGAGGGPGLRYPGKSAKDSPISELFRKLGH